MRARRLPGQCRQRGCTRPANSSLGEGWGLGLSRTNGTWYDKMKSMWLKGINDDIPNLIPWTTFMYVLLFCFLWRVNWDNIRDKLWYNKCKTAWENYPTKWYVKLGIGQDTLQIANHDLTYPHIHIHRHIHTDIWHTYNRINKHRCRRTIFSRSESNLQIVFCFSTSMLVYPARVKRRLRLALIGPTQ